MYPRQKAWTAEIGQGAFAKVFALLPTISVPHLNARATEAVQQRQCSFAAYAGDINNSRILRGYVRAWMSAAWAEFERVGLGQGMRESV